MILCFTGPMGHSATAPERQFRFSLFKKTVTNNLVMGVIALLAGIDGKIAIPVKQLKEFSRESSGETKEIMLPAPVETWTPRILNL